MRATARGGRRKRNRKINRRERNKEEQKRSGKKQKSYERQPSNKIRISHDLKNPPS
jgi:hypothetical protein